MTATIDRAEHIRRLEDAKLAEATHSRAYRNARNNTNQAMLDAHDAGIDPDTICATILCNTGRLDHALATRTAKATRR